MLTFLKRFSLPARLAWVGACAGFLLSADGVFADADQLDDAWEDEYGLATNSAAGADGDNGNQDGDFIPSVSPWPKAIGQAYNVGVNFPNIAEFRGYDGIWQGNITCAGIVTRGDDPVTDPTAEDTDGDGMPDGWEYYFWRWRGAGMTTPSGCQTNVTGAQFDPCSGGDPAGDADGDGLSNIGEFNAGTDPTHFDTDRDGMDDNWEINEGLNPLDPNDSDDNPDDDDMARRILNRSILGTNVDVTLYHSQVYLASAPTMEAGDTGFDPTTAWDGGTPPHNNTTDYTSYDEYLGADRVARVLATDCGIVYTNISFDDTKPLDPDSDDDLISDGWENYVGLNPRSGDNLGDPDSDGVNNGLEWASQQANVVNNSGSLTNWSNKLWPTDPGVLNRVFAWQNVWFDANTNGLYDPGETNLYWGGYGVLSTGLYPHAAGFTTPSGTIGIVSPNIATVYAPDGDYPIVYDAASRPDAGAAVWVDYIADGDFTLGFDFLLPTGAAAPTNGTPGTSSGLLFYHNDFHPSDTDWDGLPDSTVTGGGEKGGNGNPTSVDTDGDFLPDGWEVYAYDGAVPANGGLLNNDDGEDWDGDGLPNNLEYWTGTVYEWMHINFYWDDFPGRIVTRRVPSWDKGGSGAGNALRNDMPYILPPDFATDPSFSVSLGQRANTANGSSFYRTTRADDADTDLDGMDDYWEVYHGLNPTKGSRDLCTDPVPNTNGDRFEGSGAVSAGIDANPVTVGRFEYGLVNSLVPFLTLSNMLANFSANGAINHVGPFNLGLELMDADADGLPNITEYSYEDAFNSGRDVYHTDPTSWLRTDRHSNTNGSFVTQNYTFDNYPPTTALGFRSQLGWTSDSGFPFKFETVEGFDTDNDLVRDTDEIVGQETPGATGGTDPLDSRDPVRNRALIVRAANRDFMRTMNSWGSALPSLLQKFTVEAWVRPMTVSGDNRVIADRSYVYPIGAVNAVLSNFRLGITNNGRPYILFNDTSFLGPGTARTFVAVGSAASALQVGRWTHLAGTYNGTNINLYVDGNLVGSTPAAAVPVNGYVVDPVNFGKRGNTMIGARDANPLTAALNVLDGVESLGPFFSVGATNFWDGYIDEVRVWNGARTQAEIQNNMRTKLTRSASGLASTLEHYFTFDECPDVDVNWTTGGVPAPDEPIAPPVLTASQGPLLPLHQTILPWSLYSQRSLVYTGTPNAAYNYIVFAEDHVAHKALVPARDDEYHDTTNSAGVSIYPSGYKNSSNPYERRSNLIRLTIDRPNIDLLFCNRAQVDGDIFLTDSWLPGIGGDPDETDTDGDGLPDNWETFYGLDPFEDAGDQGTYGDPDNDGLNNLAEFRAGTDPMNFDTDGDGLSDYDEAFGPGQTLGEVFADGDNMDDAWEAQYSGALSPLLYDADQDPDGDGWSNFAEFMFNGRGVTGTVCKTNPTEPNDYPRPFIGFLLKYNGANRSGNIIIKAYNDEAMNFEHASTTWASPGLAAQGSFTTNGFSGHLREGPTWFFAFWDNDGDGSFTEGEPAGIAQGQPHTMGWGNMTNVVIGLTDDLPGYKRFNWAQTAANIHTVSITRTTSAGAPVVLRREQIRRPYFHEGDYQYQGIYGLPAGESDIPGYQWFAGGESDSFNQNWSAGLNKPIPVTPNGGPLLYGKSELVWKMDFSAVNVELQILSGSPAGPVVYEDTLIPAPYREADGSYRYTLPIYVGDSILGSGTYFWRVLAKNPRKTSVYSDFASFTVNTTNAFPNVYSISGTVQYFGEVTKGRYIIQAFNNPGLGGVPSAQTSLAAEGAYKLCGLPAGTYYLRAFLDQNKNGKLDGFESYGFNVDLANTDCDGVIQPVTVPVSQVNQTLVVRDRDTNNDNIPDAYNYQYLSKQFQRADMDGDGIGDLGVYHQAGGTWYFARSSDNTVQTQPFGWAEAIPVPGDYDADSIRDVAVFHQPSATWYLMRSSAGFHAQQFGWPGVAPAPGDFDGDGQRDLAIYHADSGIWYILQSASQTVRSQQFGFGGTIAVPGDYDGDGQADVAVYHPLTGDWYLMQSAGNVFATRNWGWIAASPVPADYDGDGKTDLAVYHQAAGDWYIQRSSDNQIVIENWGWAAARPVPSDYDDDGLADLAVYNTSDGTWYIRLSAGGNYVRQFGWREATPVSSDAALMNSRTP